MKLTSSLAAVLAALLSRFFHGSLFVTAGGRVHIRSCCFSHGNCSSFGRSASSDILDFLFHPFPGGENTNHSVGRGID